MMRWHERIRWLCRLIVKGRTSVRLATPELPKLSCIPIFLTGVFRSGTTLVRNIIDSHSKICCPPETNFLRPMADIVNVFENIEALRALGFDEAHVIAKIREFAAYFLENYAKSTGKPRWADKTPGYTMYLDFLDKLFPEALYVMIYRHPLDTAHSISRGGTHFPPYAKPFADDTGDPRIAAANYWRVCCEKMMDFHESHADRCFRIHYEELCSTPESTLRELFAFLNEPWEPTVMEFHRFTHDSGMQDERAFATKGFSISRDNYLQWPRDIVDRAAQAAQPVMSRLGYSIAMPNEFQDGSRRKAQNPP